MLRLRLWWPAKANLGIIGSSGLGRNREAKSNSYLICVFARISLSIFGFDIQRCTSAHVNSSAAAKTDRRPSLHRPVHCRTLRKSKRIPRTGHHFFLLPRPSGGRLHAPASIVVARERKNGDLWLEAPGQDRGREK